MASANPGKLNIKLLQSQLFEQTQSSKNELPIKLGRKPPGNAPMFLNSRGSIIPPKNTKNRDRSETSDTQPVPPEPVPKPAPVEKVNKLKQITQTFEQPKDFKKELPSKVTVPQQGQKSTTVGNVKKWTAAKPTVDCTKDNTDKAERTSSPSPQPLVLSYKGNRLPSRVQINGTMYQLIPLPTDTGEPAPSRPIRTPDVVPIVPKDAYDDEVYDNNRNLIEKIHKDTADGGRGDIPEDSDSNEENYDDCLMTDDPTYEKHLPGNAPVTDECYDDCFVDDMDATAR